MGKEIETKFGTILEALNHHAQTRPNEVVLRRLGFRNKVHDELTFSDLRDSAMRFAQGLRKISDPHDRILLAYPSCNAFIVAFVGCLYARRVPVPVSLGSNARSNERILTIAKDCDPSVLVSSTPDAEGLNRVVQAGCVTVDHDVLAEESDQLPLPRTVPEDICFLQYTSGSTGQPKGVIVTHENLAVNLTQILDCIGHTHSRIVSWLPHFHDMGLIGTLLLPVYCAMQTTYMSPLEFIQRPIRWLQALSDYQAHTSVAPNFGFSYLLERLRPGDLDGLDLSSVDTLLCGSEPIDADLLERFSERLADCGLNPNALLPVYGMAEATLIVTSHARKEPVRTQSFKNMRKALVSCGAPVAGMAVQILDPDGKTCAEGIEGEIAISGPNVSVGYWGMKPTTGPLHTGDLGFVKSGEVYISGRKKDMIIIRGQNLYPRDIELLSEARTLRAGANSCAAVSMVADDLSESFVVVQEVSEATIRAVDPEVLRRDITRDLVDHLGFAPAKIIFARRNTAPRTTSGKISRFELRRLLAQEIVVDAFAEKRAEGEAMHA